MEDKFWKYSMSMYSWYAGSWAIFSNPQAATNLMWDISQALKIFTESNIYNIVAYRIIDLSSSLELSMPNTVWH